MKKDESLEFLLKEERLPRRVRRSTGENKRAPYLGEQTEERVSLTEMMLAELNRIYGATIPKIYKTSILVYEYAGKYF